MSQGEGEGRTPATQSARVLLNTTTRKQTSKSSKNRHRPPNDWVGLMRRPENGPNLCGAEAPAAAADQRSGDLRCAAGGGDSGDGELLAGWHGEELRVDVEDVEGLRVLES